MEEPETEELTSQEQTEVPAEEPAPPEPKRKRSGPGFRRGVIFGALAGAAAAMLMRPRDAGDADEPEMQTPAEAPSAEAEDGTVDRLRARLRDASAEARRAAQEAEQAKRARFRDLIEDDES